MRAATPKRAKELRQYRFRRILFLAGLVACEFPECFDAPTEVHHRRGRVGADLLDEDHWSGLCHAHHAWITEHPKAALEMGLSEYRTGAR